MTDEKEKRKTKEELRQKVPETEWKMWFEKNNKGEKGVRKKQITNDGEALRTS